MSPASRAGAMVDETYWTSLKYLSISRLVVAGVLVALAPLSGPGAEPGPGAGGWPLQGVALVYLALAVALLASVDALRPHFQAQLVMQTVADLVALTALIHVAGGVRSGFGILLIAPVAGAAILATPLAAGSFAASAALLLLAETGWRALDGPGSGPEFVQAGLTGAACFAAAAVANRLARRLVAQEGLARRRGEDLRDQLAINELVIADLPDGVVVLAPQGQLRMMNRSARELLGEAPSAPGASAGQAVTPLRDVTGHPGDGIASPSNADVRPGQATAQPGAAARPALLPARWRALSAAHAAWRAAGGPPGHVAEVGWPADGADAGCAGGAHRVRLRFLGAPRVGGDTVVVIEDLDRVEQRAQQLKLAAMGRLSASIAHEIRNPLGAIRHANGLLAERLDDARLRRLSQIVEDNSVRINRVIEHVLSIARRERAVPEPLDAGALLRAFVPEFAAQQGVPADRIALAIDTGAPLMFDAGHLRQVLVNLVGNALRYASDAPGAVAISWRAAAGDRLELSVSDDGPGLTPEQAQHAFEPFFTTEARGTGLGLYLVRELCASNGASIRYERHAPGARHRGAFVIVPAPPRR